MKNLLCLYVLFLVPVITFAGDPKIEKLKQLIKPGNKVYVYASEENYKENAVSILREGCWQIVSSPEDADFIIKFEVKRIPTIGLFAHALFLDPGNKEVIYKTGGSNTSMRMTFNQKRAIFIKLIRRRILPLCDTTKLENLILESEMSDY
jgi:hypothetical protein